MLTIYSVAYILHSIVASSTFKKKFKSTFLVKWHKYQDEIAKLRRTDFNMYVIESISSTMPTRDGVFRFFRVPHMMEVTLEAVMEDLGRQMALAVMPVIALSCATVT